MKILLFGVTGQVGYELQAELLKDSMFEVTPITRSQCDLYSEDSNKVHEIINRWKPDVVINAAAYTNVEKAEDEPVVAEIINAHIPHQMAVACKKSGAHFIHYSTDYVFDGKQNFPYQTTDEKKPLNVYGITKSRGEDCIQFVNGSHWIFRTSWVFSNRGNNFLKKVLRLAAEQKDKKLTIICDQLGNPTSAREIAFQTVQALKLYPNTMKNYKGIYHLTNDGETNWYEFAKHTIDGAKKNGFPIAIKGLVAIPSNSYEVKAERPLNSRLDNQGFKSAFQAHNIKTWQERVNETLEDLRRFRPIDDTNNYSTHTE